MHRLIRLVFLIWRFARLGLLGLFLHLKIFLLDIFYHHRPDPDTPLYETMSTLDLMVRQGKALYVGLSNYPAPLAAQAIDMLRELGTPCLIHQPRYSMLDRWVEEGLLNVLADKGVGCIPFSPLAQGMFSNRYLHGIPTDSRAGKAHGFLKSDQITEARLAQIRALNELAQARGQSLAQMALAWLLKDPRITSVLVGASSAEQLRDSLACLQRLDFAADELSAIEAILA